MAGPPFFYVLYRGHVMFTCGDCEGSSSQMDTLRPEALDGPPTGSTRALGNVYVLKAASNALAETCAPLLPNRWQVRAA